MSEPTPPSLTPLNYEPPPPEDNSQAVGRFIGGVLAGGAVTYAIFFFSLLNTIDLDVPPGAQHHSALAQAAPFVLPWVVVPIGYAIRSSKRFRAFGLGVMASVPLVALALLIICGGMMR